MVFESAVAAPSDNYNNKAAVHPGQKMAFADTLRLANLSAVEQLLSGETVFWVFIFFNMISEKLMKYSFRI